MLADLEQVQNELKNRLDKYDVNAMLEIDAALWQDIVKSYETLMNTDEVSIVGNHTMRVKTAKNYLVYISSQEFRQIWACLPYARALFDYRKACDKIAAALGFVTRKAGAKYFKNMPARHMEKDDSDKVRAAIKTVFPSDVDDQAFMESFLFEAGWSGVSKTLERGDWVSAAIVSAGDWLNVAADRRGELTEALVSDVTFESRLKAILDAARTGPVVTGAPVTRLKGGGNHIFYGAPGTGKSYAIKEAVEKAGALETKTVFHPDMQNSDFIGTLKPFTEDGTIGYRFAPGSFLKAYVEAWNNPEKEVWLVIEELNRAPAAAVFGELFLLLDRTEDGSGEYPVDYPSPECLAWVQNAIAASISDRPEKMRLPSNFHIACTLNSADQGVYPLDTAFRRRWSQHYIPIDEMAGPDASVKVVFADGSENDVPWKRLVRSLNIVMKEHGIREDRLLGPWFAGKHDFGPDGIIPGKVLVYLWDDLFRNHDKSVLFRLTGNSYGELVSKISDGKPVFSDRLLKEISEQMIA